MGKITDTVKVLLIINVLFYFGTMFLFPQAQDYLALWFIKNPNFEYWQPITHMFMHDQNSIFHILFNMYALWAFGSPIEQVLGQKKFVFFYFAAGLGAAFLHTAVGYFQYNQGFTELINAGRTPREINDFMMAIYERVQTGVGNYNIPAGFQVEHVEGMVNAYNSAAVGASGAIYGVLVAFGMLFPNMELMLIFLPIPIKAKYFIPGLLLLDLFSGVTGFSVFGQNIANFAHLGGALFGFIMIYFWKKNSFNNTRWN